VQAQTVEYARFLGRQISFPPVPLRCRAGHRLSSPKYLWSMVCQEIACGAA